MMIDKIHSLGKTRFAKLKNPQIIFVLSFYIMENMNFTTFKTRLSILISCTLPTFLNAQTPLILGSGYENIAHSICIYNSEYYIAGTYRKEITNAKDSYIIVLNADGSIRKEATHGFLRHDVASQIYVDDQGIFIIGSAYDFGFPNVDMHLFQLNHEGILEWERFYGTQYQDMGFSMTRTSDGGFALLGYTNSQIDGGDFYLVKTDVSGNLNWERTFGPDFVDYGFCIIENKNGELIMAGSENGFFNPTQTDFKTPHSEILIIKTDAAGNQIWYKKLGGSGHDWAKDIIEAPEGGYYLCGSTQSYGSGNFDIYLSKINENGDLIWYRTFGGEHFDYGEKLALTNDGHIYLIGTSASYSNDFNPDHVLIKTDLEGNLVWQKVLGTENPDYSGDLVVTSDQGVVFTGWTRTGKMGNSDIVVVRFNKEGRMDFISHMEADNPIEENIKIFPNPSLGNLRLDLSTFANDPIQFNITNIAGNQIFSVELTSQKIHVINPGLKAGVYLYSVILDGSNRYSGKLIIQD